MTDEANGEKAPVDLADYRKMFKGVLVETLHENDSVVRQIIKEAIKEWLQARFQDKESLLVKLLAITMVAAFAYWIFLRK